MCCYMLVDWAHCCSALWRIDSGAAAGAGSVRVVKLSYSGPDVKTELISVGRSLCQDTTAMVSWTRPFTAAYKHELRKPGKCKSWRHLPTTARCPAGCLTPKQCSEQKSDYILDYYSGLFVLRKSFQLHFCCLVTVEAQFKCSKWRSLWEWKRLKSQFFFLSEQPGHQWWAEAEAPRRNGRQT